MPLYNPPLRVRSKKDWNSAPQVFNTLESFEKDYFFTGIRLNKHTIELKVSTVIQDVNDELFLWNLFIFRKQG